MTPDQILRGLWEAGVEAVDGYTSVARGLENIDTPPDRIVAVGKAAAAMTRAALAKAMA